MPTDREQLESLASAYEAETNGQPIQPPSLPGPAEDRLARHLANSGYVGYQDVMVGSRTYYYYKMMASGPWRIGAR
jgi:hypothetical protein